MPERNGHPACDWHDDSKTWCSKYAQIRLTYILNRQALVYVYCPIHSRKVQAHLAHLGIACAVENFYEDANLSIRREMLYGKAQ